MPGTFLFNPVAQSAFNKIRAFLNVQNKKLILCLHFSLCL